MEKEAKPLAASGPDRVRVCCWLLLELCLPTDRMAVHTRWGSCMTSGDHAVNLQVAVCACFWGLLENMAPSKSRSTDCKGETPDMCGGLGILTPTISLILHSLWEVIVIIVPILQIWGTDTYKPCDLPKTFSRSLGTLVFKGLIPHSEASCLKSKKTPDKGHSKYISFL